MTLNIASAAVPLDDWIIAFLANFLSNRVFGLSVLFNLGGMGEGWWLHCSILYVADAMTGDMHMGLASDGGTSLRCSLAMLITSPLDHSSVIGVALLQPQPLIVICQYLYLRESDQVFYCLSCTSIVSETERQWEIPLKLP
nr:hypothetical protein [Tanacetum cinerariifolium]